MDLKSMKVEHKEPEAKDVLYGGDAPKMEYPWGLQIRLGEDELKKLGMDLPKVGEELMVTAKVKVSSTSSHEREDGANRNVELQITDMGIGKE